MIQRKTHFEQVPLEAVKKIIGERGELAELSAEPAGKPKGSAQAPALRGAREVRSSKS